MPREWVVAEGREPIPGIGPGPLSAKEFEERARAYLRRGWPGARLPLRTVTESGVYVERESADIPGAVSGNPALPGAAPSHATDPGAAIRAAGGMPRSRRED